MIIQTEKLRMICLMFVLIFFFIAPLAKAETTFFDNPNDAFIMGHPTTGGVIGGTINGGSSISGGTGGSVGGGNGSSGGTTLTQCSQVGQPCAITADCCKGNCVNYTCSAQETTAATRVRIVAPPSVQLNDVVVLKMIDENNKSVANATILVTSPTKESLTLITDSNGGANFTATEVGVYTYEAPGRYLILITVTNVVNPAPAQPCQPQWSCADWSACINETQTRACRDINNCGTSYSKPDESQGCQSEATQTGSSVVWIIAIAGLAILLIIFIFLRKWKRSQ